MHARFVLPQQIISQMFFSNITGVPGPPIAPSSSAACPSRLPFDRETVRGPPSLPPPPLPPPPSSTTAAASTICGINSIFEEDEEKQLIVGRQSPAE